MLSVLLIFADQISKYSVRRFGGFFICNKSLAWGINMAPPLFWFIWAIIMAGLLFILLAGKSGRAELLLALILAGAVSNMIDRVFPGCVIDFINLGFWPVFNLADIFISLGALGLLARFVKLW